MQPPFLEALDSRVLVCDGAMGTMLYAKGVFINRSFDALNVTSPDLVGEVHQEYVRAGADIIETNTFGANRTKLGTFGLGDRLHAINVEGARIARLAAGGRAYVAGSVGPLCIRIEPGEDRRHEARDAFVEQARGLVAGGVDLFILETFLDLNEIGAAIDAVRRVSDLPIIAQMTTEEDGNTLDGTPPERFTPELERRGANVLGVNCAVGPAPMLETIERMAAVTKLQLSAQPNAGRPRDVEGRTLYLCSPEYMASYARRFILHNVRVVGGCCGTTPEHIRQIKAAVGGLARSAAVSGVAGADTKPTRARSPGGARTSNVAVSPVPREDKSRFAYSLARGRFVVAVEVVSPHGVDYQEAIAQARLLKVRVWMRSAFPTDADRRANQRPVAGGADRAAGGHRDAPVLRVSRSELARHPVGSARRPCHGAAQSAAHHRRPGPRRGLSGCHRRLRRRLDRPDQPRVAPQSWLRRRRPAHRGPGAVSHRRVGESGGAEPRR